MSKENYFSRIVRNKSNAELEEYVNNPDNYQEDAVLAAIWELERRGQKTEEEEKVEKQMKMQKRVQIARSISRHGLSVGTVSPGIRFVHFLIDGFVIQLFTYLINLIPYVELSELFAFVLFPLYYVFFEYTYQWTPGKLVSETVVVTKEGNRPSIQSILLRTFARYVPFEPFSCFDTNSWGWHDRWSKSYVIYKRDLARLREGQVNEPIPVTARNFDKTSKIIVGVFIIALAIGVLSSNWISSGIEQASFAWVQEIDEVAKKDVLGNWRTPDDKLGVLNFVSADVVISDVSGNLNYIIENRVLTITDNDQLSMNYVIVESSSFMLTLIDTEEPAEQIIWIRIGVDNEFPETELEN